MNDRKWLGIIVIAIGSILLLNRLDVIAFDVWDIIWDFWPMLLILGGLTNLYRRKTFNPGAFIVILIGVAFQLKTLDIFNVFGKGMFWPILFIAIGLVILIPKKNNFFGNTDFSEANEEDFFDEMVIFSGANIKNISKQFKGGNAKAMFGGMDIDLRDAIIDPTSDSITININAIFGGIDLFIPKDWNIKVTGTPLFGGFDNKTSNVNGDGPVVKINCTCVFGGSDIKN